MYVSVKKKKKKSFLFLSVETYCRDASIIFGL